MSIVCYNNRRKTIYFIPKKYNYRRVIMIKCGVKKLNEVKEIFTECRQNDSTLYYDGRIAIS